MPRNTRNKVHGKRGSSRGSLFDRPVKGKVEVQTKTKASTAVESKVEASTAAPVKIEAPKSVDPGYIEEVNRKLRDAVKEYNDGRKRDDQIWFDPFPGLKDRGQVEVKLWELLREWRDRLVWMKIKRTTVAAYLGVLEFAFNDHWHLLTKDLRKIIRKANENAGNGEVIRGKYVPPCMWGEHGHYDSKLVGKKIFEDIVLPH